MILTCKSPAKIPGPSSASPVKTYSFLSGTPGSIGTSMTLVVSTIFLPLHGLQTLFGSIIYPYPLHSPQWD